MRVVKYTREERLEIGRKIYESEMNKNQAAEAYAISPYTAREYMRQYRDLNKLPSKMQGRRKKHDRRQRAKLDTLMTKEDCRGMTKPQLIQALLDSREESEVLRKKLRERKVKFVPIWRN